jgi:hypothetical protein
VSNTGATLIRDVQPVIASKLVPRGATTVFAAGTSAEYAGALPGSRRPALSYLVLGGLRGWADANRDGVVTASEAQTYASLVLRSLPNSHEQHPELVTDAPDAELERGAREKGPDLARIRSQVDTWKPPSDVVEAPKVGRVVVDVACLETKRLTAAAGLGVNVDGLQVLATEVDAVHGTAFPVSPGEHTVTVRAPSCADQDVQVSVEAGSTTYITGGLASDESAVARVPFGKPDAFHLGVSFAADVPVGGSSSTVNGANLPNVVLREPGRVWTLAPFLGPRVTAGFDWRFFEAGLDARVQFGSWEAYDDKNTSLGASTVVSLHGGVSAALRVPLGRVALRPLIGNVGYRTLSGNAVEGGTKTFGLLQASGGIGVDVSVSCDFAARAAVDVGGLTNPGNGNACGMLGLNLGLVYMPSSACKAERSYEPKLTTRR